MAVVGREEKEQQKGKRKLLTGEKVEVLFEDDELEGSWHDALVIGTDINCREVNYLYPIDDKILISVSPAIESTSNSNPTIYRNNIRPHQPYLRLDISDVRYGLCVDALIENAWWEGVVVDDLEGSSKRWIFLPETGKLKKDIPIENLRPTKDWDEVSEEWKLRGEWKLFLAVKPFEQNVDLPVTAGEVWCKLNGSYAYKEKIQFWHWGSVENWNTCVAAFVRCNYSVVSPTSSESSSLMPPSPTEKASKPISSTSQLVSPSTSCAPLKTTALSLQPLSMATTSPVSGSPSPPLLGMALSHVGSTPQPSASPPSSTARERSKSKNKGAWKPARIQPEPCTDSDLVSRCESYLEMGKCNGQGDQGKAAEKLRRNLVYFNWRVEFSKKYGKQRFRFRSPSGEKLFLSLPDVCKFIKSVRGRMRVVKNLHRDTNRYM